VLKGSPMREIAVAENYVFSATPPYKVLRTPRLSFAEICRIETVSRLIDLFFNSGRFPVTLAVIARFVPLSRFFAEAAAFWEETGILPNLSLSDLFNALWRFAGDGLPKGELDQFRDALCFDFCLADYPAAARLPGFFAGDVNLLAKERRAGLLEQLDIAAGCRVRTFSAEFRQDYRSPPWEGRSVELLFVYISAPGKGLRVEVLRA
jgi:anaerobic magnesium-protoporphyrin IX monomethyl ester cyclase